jgi:hypothetical protein
MTDAWSNDLEQVLTRIMINSNVMSNYHKKNYIYYKGQLKYYRIPIIIISGFNSVFSVGLQPFFEQKIISVVNCLLALVCGIISSIELFLQIADNMEKELVASKEFYLLGIDCFKMLNLDRKNRTIKGKDFLDAKYGEYTGLINTSNLVQRKIEDQLTALKGMVDIYDPIPENVSSETLSLMRPTPRGDELPSSSSDEGQGEERTNV